MQPKQVRGLFLAMSKVESANPPDGSRVYEAEKPHAFG